MILSLDSVAHPCAEPPIIAAGGVVYRHASTGQIEVLLIKKRYGFWTLPKGRVHPSETEWAAALREVMEETSITGEIECSVHRVCYTIQKGGRLRCKQVTYFLVRAQPGRLAPDPNERITRVRWFPVAVALRRIRRDRLRTVVRLACTLLTPGQERAR